jgi:hypothetical protein
MDASTYLVPLLAGLALGAGIAWVWMRARLESHTVLV